MKRFLSQPVFCAFVTVAFLLITGALHAQTVSVAESEFTLTLPKDFKLIDIDVSGVLLQADSSSGASSVQVVAGVPNVPVNALMGDYEMKMNMVFSNLKSISDETVTVGENSHLLKHYIAKNNANTVWITTLYYIDNEQSMIVHTIDMSGDGDKMKGIITSFAPPQSKRSQAVAPSVSPVAATPPATEPSHTSKSAVSLSAASSSASTAPLPTTQEDYHWFAETSSNLRMLTPKHWQAALEDKTIVFTPSDDDPLYRRGGLQMQNLSRSIEMYSTLELASQDILDFVDLLKGAYLQNVYQKINGLNCRLIEFEITLNDAEHRHLWALFVERPEMITLLQFDTSGQKETLDDAAALMRAHVLKGLDSLREL